MSKVTFIKRSDRNCVCSVPFQRESNAFSKPQFNSLNRKQRRYVQRKLKEEQNETENS